MNILKKSGAVNSAGEITEQGVSLLACLEADRLYEEIEAIYPNAMEVIYRFAELFIDENKQEALLDMIKEMYAIAGLEEPEYLEALNKNQERMIFFTEELTADWGDYLMQFCQMISVTKFSSPKVSSHNFRKLCTSVSSIEIKITPSSFNKLAANLNRGYIIFNHFV